MSIFKKKMTLIDGVFAKLGSPKNLVISISIKSRFKGSFPKQHGKRAQRLLKFPCQHLYHIYISLWMQLTSKKFMLVICKISRLFLNTLIADDKYSLFKRDNLTRPIYMQVSRDTKRFFSIFFFIFEIYFKFWTLSKKKKKKNDSHSWGISEVTDYKKRGYINV